MNYLFFENYVLEHGVHALVLSILICFFRFFLRKLFKDKLKKATYSYIEIAFSITAEFIFTVLLYKTVSAFTFKSVSSALISYSVSLMIYSLISRILTGKSISINTKTLLIEGLLSNYVNDENLTKTARAIEDAVNDEKFDKNLLLPILKDNLSSSFSDEEITALIDLIVSSLKSVK